MIGKIMKAASFSRCVYYVTGKEEARILASDGVLLTTTQDIIDSFEFQRQMTEEACLLQESCLKDNWEMSIQMVAGETLKSHPCFPTIFRICRRYMRQAVVK